MATLTRGAVALTVAALTIYYVRKRANRRTPMFPSTPKADKRPSTYACDSCGWEVSGYTREELKRDHGWKWNPLTDDEADKRRFVTCGECETYFAERREAASAAA